MTTKSKKLLRGIARGLPEFKRDTDLDRKFD